MAPNILSLAERISDRSFRSDWTNAELAELYRVEHALVQSRISIETDRGLTDEGDPWFVFCRADGEVVVHIARFGGYYRLYSPALPQPLVGPTFSALTKAFLGGLRTPVKPDEGVSIHPAALLSVLIAAIFFSIDFHSGAAHAAEAAGHGAPEQAPQAPLSQLPGKTAIFQTLVANLKAFIDSVTPWDSQQSALLATVESAAIAAMSPLAGLAESTVNVPSPPPVSADGQVSDHANGLFVNDGIKTASGSSISLKALFGQGSALLDGHDNGQPTGAPSDNAALTWQGNQFSTPTSLAPTASAELTVLPASGLQSTAENAQQVGFNYPTLLLTRAHTDPSSPGTGLAADQSAATGADNAIHVNLAQGPQTVDLSAQTGISTIDVAGNGILQIREITGTPQIDIDANSTASLSLAFSARAQAAVTIQLNGHDSVTVAAVSTDAAASSGTPSSASSDTSTSSTTAASSGSPDVNLTLDSEGNSPNAVTIADNAVASTSKLTITVMGVQDLTLNESAQTFSNSDINSAALAGSLTVSLDLGNVFQSVDLSQVSAANFIVGDSGNIALLNAASGSHIQLGSDLNIVDLSIAGATAGNPGALAVDLQNSTTSFAPISVTTLDAFSTASLAINSAGAAAGTSNAIATLTDSSLTTLTISGDSGLTIGAINGPAATDSQSITIDAHTLAGTLILDASGIADTAAAGRSITIIAGAETSFLTNNTVSESTTFVGGPGTMIVAIGAGAVNDSIVGLAVNDSVRVGQAAAYTDVVINETSLGSEQATIDHQTNVIAAAQLAATFDDTTVGHQALLFSYEGSLYVFIDAGGSHIFNINNDAIIKLVGLTATANLAGVFHSA